jgi:hypothetical protein
MSVKSQNMWAVVENQNLSGVVSSTAGQQQGNDKEPFLSTTAGKITLGAAGLAVGAGAMYLYGKSRQG